MLLREQLDFHSVEVFVVEEDGRIVDRLVEVRPDHDDRAETVGAGEVSELLQPDRHVVLDAGLAVSLLQVLRIDFLPEVGPVESERREPEEVGGGKQPLEPQGPRVPPGSVQVGVEVAVVVFTKTSTTRSGS